MRPPPEEPWQESFLSEEIAEERRDARRQLIRWSAAFGFLFCAVFFAFWWSGKAVRFGADRVADSASPTWRVSGTVRDAVTGQPIPWAAVDDDPAGRPPFYHADADQYGRFALLTMAEKHSIIVKAPGYRPARAVVGRQWFLWMPRGEESENIPLTRE